MGFKLMVCNEVCDCIRVFACVRLLRGSQAGGMSRDVEESI